VSQAVLSAPVAGVTPTREVRRLADKLVPMTLAERVAVEGIGPRRAEIIVAGAQVFAELLESFGLAGFSYSPLGLRDGILCSDAAEQTARASAHREFGAPALARVCWPTARRYGVDLHHAEPVRAHAVQLYRELQALHQLPPEVRELAAAAAILRDTASSSTTEGHHRHNRQYVRFEFGDLRLHAVQRTLVSAIARYLGKSRPQPGDRALAHIPAGEHQHVHRPWCCCGWAVALNQDARQRCAEVCGEGLSQAGLSGTAAGTRRVRNWSFGRCFQEADYFREVFGARTLYCTLA